MHRRCEYWDFRVKLEIWVLGLDRYISYSPKWVYTCMVWFHIILVEMSVGQTFVWNENRNHSVLFHLIHIFYNKGQFSQFSLRHSLQTLPKTLIGLEKWIQEVWTEKEKLLESFHHPEKAMSLAEPYGVDVSTMSSKGFPEMYYGQSQSQLVLPASYLSLAAWSYFTWRGLWALLSFGAFIWVFLVSALMYLISEKTNGLQSIGNPARLYTGISHGRPPLTFKNRVKNFESKQNWVKNIDPKHFHHKHIEISGIDPKYLQYKHIDLLSTDSKYFGYKYIDIFWSCH